MIRMVIGTAVHTETDGVVIMTHGIGYLVRTLLIDKPDIGTHVELYTHHAIRETASDLYGFSSLRDRELFEALLLVPGVGPKSALQILNQTSTTLLIEAIQSNDGTKLAKLSGLGKKTAEKVVTFLHQKELTFASAVMSDTPTDQTYEDAFDTLIALGYQPVAVRQTLEKIGATHNASELVKQALRHLSS